MAIGSVNARFKGVILVYILAGFLIGCASDNSKKDRIDVDISDVTDNNAAKVGLQSARQIFYSLPSPLETAMILKRAGAKYNEEILNPVENITRYSTNKKWL